MGICPSFFVLPELPVMGERRLASRCPTAGSFVKSLIIGDKASHRNAQGNEQNYQIKIICPNRHRRFRDSVEQDA